MCVCAFSQVPNLAVASKKARLSQAQCAQKGVVKRRIAGFPSRVMKEPLALLSLSGGAGNDDAGMSSWNCREVMFQAAMKFWGTEGEGMGEGGGDENGVGEPGGEDAGEEGGDG